MINGEKSFRKKLGARMKKQRYKIGVDISDIAEACGVGFDRYCHWEEGRATPSAYHVALICERLSCGRDDIYPDEW